MKISFRSKQRKLWDEIERKKSWEKKFLFFPKRIQDSHGKYSWVFLQSVYARCRLIKAGGELRLETMYEMPDTRAYEILQGTHDKKYWYKNNDARIAHEYLARRLNFKNEL